MSRRRAPKHDQGAFNQTGFNLCRALLGDREYMTPTRLVMFNLGLSVCIRVFDCCFSHVHVVLCECMLMTCGLCIRLFTSRLGLQIWIGFEIGTSHFLLLVFRPLLLAVDNALINK